MPFISGIIQGNAANKAGNMQADSANSAAANSMAMFNKINEQLSPYRDFGKQALSPLSDLLGFSGNTNAAGYGSLLHQFNASDLNANLAPNYEFGLQQGLGNARNQLNASGGLIGGNAMQGLNTFAQNYAQNAYQQAYNNYNNNQNNIFSRLSDIAGIGQNAAVQTGEFGTAATRAANDYSTSAAAAKAAGVMGQANAYAGAFNNANNMAMNIAMLAGL